MAGGARGAPTPPGVPGSCRRRPCLIKLGPHLACASAQACSFTHTLASPPPTDPTHPPNHTHTHTHSSTTTTITTNPPNHHHHQPLLTTTPLASAPMMTAPATLALAAALTANASSAAAAISTRWVAPTLHSPLAFLHGDLFQAGSLVEAKHLPQHLQLVQLHTAYA